MTSWDETVLLLLSIVELRVLTNPYCQVLNLDVVSLISFL